MADVNVISSSIVQPRNIDHQSGREKIHLTPSDIYPLCIQYATRGLLFPKPDAENNFISRLKSSLSAALDIYFPFAGRLVQVTNHEDNTVSFYIDTEDGLGVKFVHAEANSISVSDLLQPDGSIPDFFRHFFPMNGVKSIDGLSQPFLAFQVTEIKDGIFISFSYNHIVADGSSMWNFFHTWSKICSNNCSSSDFKPLVLRGWFLDGIDYPIHIPFSEIKMPPSYEISPAPTLMERVFHFTGKQISDLKAKAIGEIGSSDLKISSLQALLAHLWRSMIKHSGLSQEEESHCRIVADMRQRLNPPLEKDCFGNVIHLGIATATVGELLDHGLGWTALHICKMVKSITSEDYITYSENWARNVRIPKKGLGTGVVSRSLMVTSSPWFPVYDNDFGWGKPIAVRAGPCTTDGGRIVLFRGVEQGSIDVQATIWSDALISLTDV